MVFVLGSGFSRDIAGYPSLEELTYEVMMNVEAGAGDDQIRAFIMQYAPLAVRENIEYLLTYLSQEYPWRSDKDKSQFKAAYHYIVKLISDVLIKKYEKEKKSGALQNKNAEELIRFWHKWESPVITFNYDTLVESLCMKHNQVKSVVASRPSLNFKCLNRLIIEIQTDMPSADGISVPEFNWDADAKVLSITLPNRAYDQDKIIQQLNEYEKENPKFISGTVSLDYPHIRGLLEAVQKNIGLEDIYQVPIRNVRSRRATLFSHERQASLKLVKLHGSVNWYTSKFGNNLGSQTFYGALEESDDAQQNEIELNKKGLEPLIIPPVLDKNNFFFNETIAVQWEDARDWLAGADEIFFIGYSLPNTDLATRFLLQEAISKKDSRLTVFVKENGSFPEGERKAKEMESRYLELVNGDEGRLVFINLETATSCLEKVMHQLSSTVGR